jgi:threonine dehydratase
VSASAFPTLEDVRSAAAALSGVARITPVLTDDQLDEATGSSVSVKAEFLQCGGAYKFRGIYNKIRLLTADERARGIVTVSSGNAGIAAAYAARLHGAACVVVMPARPSPHKVLAIEALGGRAIRHGSSSTEMFERAHELVDNGLTFVHPFDQAEVIAGQGTVALELLEQAPDIDVLLVPTAGGGLLAGISLVLGAAGRLEIELVGVQPEGAAALQRSLAGGAVEELAHVDTLADGLLVRRCGELTFELIRDRVDDVVLVSDDEILAAVAMYWRILHVAIEPAGAASLAALLRHDRFRDRRVGVVASGANVRPELLLHALDGRSAEEWKAGDGA